MRTENIIRRFIAKYAPTALLFTLLHQPADAASVGGRLSDAPAGSKDPDPALVRLHLARAKQIAEKDLTYWYNYRCITDQVNADFPGRSAMEPRKVFDDLYYLGSEQVSVWAVDTTEGIVLMDAGNNPEEAERYIIGGLKQLGLDPNRIKYVVITHSHGDHYGGAQFLSDRFGARLIASELDWADMQRQSTITSGPRAEWAKLVPKKDMVVTDGQKFVVGGNLFTFYVAGGHTPGSLAVLFKVNDRGRTRVASNFGGMGMPFVPEQLRGYKESLLRYSDLARSAGADVMISNHQRQDQSMAKLDELRWFPDRPNPYVMSPNGIWRYYRLHAACADVALARQGLAN